MDYLSVRTADSLYWMGRYLQRFETTAKESIRSFDLIIDINPYEGKELFERLGSFIEYNKTKDFFTKAVFSVENANLAYLIQQARENAITSRDTLDDDAFSSVNTIYNALCLTPPSEATPKYIESLIRELDRFWGLLLSRLVKRKSHTFIQFGQTVEIIDLKLRLFNDISMVMFDIERLNVLGKNLNPHYKTLTLKSSDVGELLQTINRQIYSIVKYAH